VQVEKRVGVQFVEQAVDDFFAVVLFLGLRLRARHHAGFFDQMVDDVFIVVQTRETKDLRARFEAAHVLGIHVFSDCEVENRCGLGFAGAVVGGDGRGRGSIFKVELRA
jgi:hypothetical protein